MKVIIEAVLFWIAITPRWRLWPTHDYIHWRFGTVYGSFDRETGKPRPVRALIADAWRDRTNGIRFLKWRRRMRGA